MELSPVALIAIGLILSAWTVGAAWMMIAAGARMRHEKSSQHTARRLARMIEEAPAIPLIVRTDGRIEGADRLAGWLGLDTLPEYLSELDAGEGEGKGISTEQLAELDEKIRYAQKTAAPFRMALTLPGSQRSLAVRGVLADPQISPGGAALIWIFDFSESEGELSRLREEAARARGDFGALVGIIEAAPMPMWFRDSESKLRLVNQAYVRAIGAENADAVINDQAELIESVDGLTAAQIASQAAAKNMPIERNVTATIDGQRRSVKVSDLPLTDQGVAGYAIDIEEMEEQSRQTRAFRDAQRSMLDQLSVGVGQFSADRKLVFANQPFHRTFSLHSGAVTQGIDFERLLSDARENGRTPEVRDFPAWRAEHVEWLSSGTTQEEAWPLSDGTHLRVIAQPMPDGGLVLIAEDRTEQLALSATRDTLLRTRTATFDSLFEALAVFAPDGHLQLWNRSFAGMWGLDPDQLDTHPSAEELLDAIAPNLAKPKQAKAIGEAIRAATLDRQNQGGRLPLADGRTLEFAGVPLPDGNGLLTVLDITASQDAETTLKERNQALEAADDVKTRFLANMSYEFRTPLTSIGGFAELLESGVAGELSDQARDYVTAILDSVARLTDQVENVLDLSQSEAGLLPLHKQRLDVLSFMVDVVQKREQRIKEADITLDLQGSKISGKMEADPRQLGRAIGQLLDNSIAATAKNGKILVSLLKSKGGAQIVISDNGEGMTRQELDRAMGFAAEAGTAMAKQGIGIRLAQHLIEAHGGTLSVVSRKGEGTTATITIP